MVLPNRLRRTNKRGLINATFTESAWPGVGIVFVLAGGTRAMEMATPTGCIGAAATCVASSSLLGAHGSPSQFPAGG